MIEDDSLRVVKVEPQVRWLSAPYWA